MPGIYCSAILTSCAALTVFGIALHKLPLPCCRRRLWLAALIALPLQPLAFYLVRVPLDTGVAALLDRRSAAYAWVSSLYAPLTEEAAKLFPLLVPAILRDIRRENAVCYALAIGAGFAVGEMWFVAGDIARRPALAALPFHQFGGYMVERLMTCIFHSAFVSISLVCLQRKLAIGFAGAATLHWVGNFPVFLRSWDVGGLGRPVWTTLIYCFLGFYFLCALALLSRLAFGRVIPARILFGRRHCPECAADYDAPLLALNFFRTRFERCPHCRHWHWTRPATSRHEANENRTP